jgi:hypothetical protein
MTDRILRRVNFCLIFIYLFICFELGSSLCLHLVEEILVRCVVCVFVGGKRELIICNFLSLLIDLANIPNGKNLNFLSKLEK